MQTKVIRLLSIVVQYTFLLIILNMGIMLISIASFGLLAPLAVYFAFMVINGFINNGRISVNSINFKNGILFAAIVYIQFIIIYQYIKVIPYASLLSYDKMVYAAFGIICVYFYIFDMYFMFLSTKEIEMKKSLQLAIIAPFHSIKQSLLLVLMLCTSIIFLIYFDSLLLLIGVALLLCLGNVVLESYYQMIKE